MAETNATSAREAGNALYREGHTIEALIRYFEAANLDPEDARVHSNISACTYETGEYEKSAAAARQALALFRGENDTLEDKVRQRLVSSLLHLRQVKGLREIINAVKSPARRRALLKCHAHIEATLKAFPSPEQSRDKISKGIRNYKPVLFDNQEYFLFGHDDVWTLYDAPLRKHVSRDATVSLLFAGAGDARHLYGTLASIFDAESQAATERIFRLVTNDINHLSLARNLVIWLMLDDLAAVPDEIERDHVLSALHFTFSAAMMPADASGRLQGAIKSAIACIEGRKQLPVWIVLRDEDKPVILSALKAWRDQAPTYFDINTFMATVISAVQRDVNPDSLDDLDYYNKQSHAAEVNCYRKSLALFPRRRTLRDDEPELEKLIERYTKTKKPAVVAKIRSYVQEKWKPNVTIINVNGEELAKKIRKEPRIIETKPSPWSLPKALSDVTGPETFDRVYGYTSLLFYKAAKAVEMLGTRLSVRISHGDITDTLERLRYNQSEVVNVSDEGIPSEHVKQTFDRIHLSNIPDYVGGSLFTYLYAVPMLKHHANSFATSTCLRNLMQWNSVSEFDNEYVLLNSPDFLQQALQVKRGKPWDPASDSIPAMLPMFQYHTWRKSREGPYTFSQLMSRDSLTQWLFGLFLKLMLPASRGTTAPNALVGVDEKIWTPCTPPHFFRLLIHLHSLGYPSHWLSSVLLDILTDKMSTTARPPKTSPLAIEEVNKRNPEIHIPTSPYQAEMSTLTTIFTPTLPFAVEGPGLDLSLPTRIYEYSIRFDIECPIPDIEVPEFVLVFLRCDILEQSRKFVKQPVASGGLRKLLQHEEALKEFPDSIHVVNCWTFDWKTNTGTFWMGEEVVGQMLAENGVPFLCDIVRTDNWKSALSSSWPDPSQLTPVMPHTIRKGRCWV